MSDNPVAYTLREAAHRTRSLADMANYGPWESFPEDPIPGFIVLSQGVVPVASTFERSERGYNAAHIAAWSPPAACAVAEMWEQIADDMDDHEAVEREYPEHIPTARWLVNDELGDIRYDWTAALAAARLFMGEPDPNEAGTHVVLAVQAVSA